MFLSKKKEPGYSKIVIEKQRNNLYINDVIESVPRITSVLSELRKRRFEVIQDVDKLGAMLTGLSLLISKSKYKTLWDSMTILLYEEETS